MGENNYSDSSGRSGDDAKSFAETKHKIIGPVRNYQSGCKNLDFGKSLHAYVQCHAYVEYLSCHSSRECESGGVVLAGLFHEYTPESCVDRLANSI